MANETFLNGLLAVTIQLKQESPTQSPPWTHGMRNVRTEKQLFKR